MKKLEILLIGVIVICGLVAYTWTKRGPIIPIGAETIIISLREPSTDEIVVEKTISDQKVIRDMTGLFSSARPCSDHKCASIGEIAFISGSHADILEVLPGHDAAKYEFRINRRIFWLPRESYIAGLVAAGIDRNDLRIDPHSNIEQAGADQPATKPADKPSLKDQPSTPTSKPDPR